MGEDDLLADSQAESDAFVIESVWVVQLAIPREESLQVSFADAASGVLHVHYQHVLDEVIAGLDVDGAARGVFQRIFNQVDQHLLQADLVSVQPRQP